MTFAADFVNASRRQMGTGGTRRSHLRDVVCWYSSRIDREELINLGTRARRRAFGPGAFSVLILITNDFEVVACRDK